jgi:hypothetical protein
MVLHKNLGGNLWVGNGAASGLTNLLGEERKYGWNSRVSPDRESEFLAKSAVQQKNVPEGGGLFLPKPKLWANNHQRFSYLSTATSISRGGYTKTRKSAHTITCEMFG